MLFGVIIYNVVCAITCMIVVSAEAIGDLILACVYIPFLGAMFFLVYRRLYKAAKSGSSLSYFAFFVGYTVQIIISILATIGLKRSGFMGIVWTVSGFAENKAAGVMCLINSILWGVSSGLCIYLWIHTRVNFKQAGGLDAVRKQAVEKATLGAIKAAKENPDLAKKAGKAAVDYAKENPELAREAVTAAYGQV